MINKIHLGDCLELFPKLEDNSVDLIVAGPPYNIDIKYDSPFNDCVEWSEYLEWTESWLSECYRVLKDDGRICVNHQITIVDKYTNESRFPIMDIRNIQDKIGFNVHKLIIWEDGSGWKWKGSPEKRWGGGTWKSAQKPYISNVYESILISCKKDWKRLENGKTTITEKDFVDATKQIWNIETSGGHGQRGAFGSIELPKRCIELLSYENDLVLDPFMGSGSTAIACKETNRRYIGFEISESSVELSNDKLMMNWAIPYRKPPTQLTNDHVIITSGRTGSNLLCAILNMHPECINRGEIFGEIRNLFLSKISWERPGYMIENFWFRDYHNLESKGFKYLYFQDLKRNSNISDFVKKGDFKIIHLKRRNKLKQYISWKKVKEGDEWGDNFLINNGDNPWLNSKIEIDVDDLLNRFKIEEEQEKIYDEKFPNALEVYYEDMTSDFSLEFTEDNNKTIQKCFEYLNLDYQRMIDGKQDVNSFLKETDLFALEKYNLENYTAEINNEWFDNNDNRDFILKKSRILPIQDCVLNYDEVKEKLYRTKYANYLEETPSLHSECDDFLVFNKPSFWSCSAPGSDTNNFPDWVSEYMKNKFDIEVLDSDWCNLLHRYDFETSGMILVGKDTKNLQNLKDEITWNGLTNKYYYALVNGILDKKEGDIIKPIKQNWPDCSTIDDDGEPSHSRYEVIKEFDNRFSLVKVNLISCGRTHQIRVHFKSIGHPLVSDYKYMENDYKELLESNLEITPDFQLHNCRLDFKYKEKEYIFESPLPVTFESVLEKLSSKEYFDLEMKDKLYNLFESNNFNIDILKSNKSYMRGGAILRLFMGIPLTDADLDLYFLDSKYFKRVDDYFNEHYEFLHETPNTKSYKCGELEFELVRHPYLIGTYEYTTSMTDFTITLGSFHFETELFVYPDTYLADIESKKLRIHRLEIEPPEGRSWANALERVEKYGKLGFTASDDVVETIKKYSELKDNDEFHQRTVKMSWLRNKDLTPIVPNIDVFVNWLMDIKEHEYFDKFNYYLTGGFISWPDKTKDVDIIITKRDGQVVKLNELEELMVDMFNLAYDIHKFFLDTFYMRTPQWIADYPRSREILKSVEKKQLFITITKHKPPTYVVDFKRYGKLNCLYMGMWKKWWKDDDPSSLLIHRWVDLNSEYAKWVDLRRIIKYYENNNKRNIEDFLNEFQEYSGY